MTSKSANRMETTAPLKLLLINLASPHFVITQPIFFQSKKNQRNRMFDTLAVNRQTDVIIRAAQMTKVKTQLATDQDRLSKMLCSVVN